MRYLKFRRESVLNSKLARSFLSKSVSDVFHSDGGVTSCSDSWERCFSPGIRFDV
jgi:hypothetical protein